MLTINPPQKSVSDSGNSLSNRRYDSQSSPLSISSSTLPSTVEKVENNQISRFKSITKSIKSATNSIFKGLIKSITSDDIISDAEYSRLVGITIDPRIARKYENIIDFNGTGKIESLRKNSIKKDDYYILINNKIRPLNETPYICKDRIRTPGEAVVNIAGILKRMGDDLINKQEIEEIIKSTWLDGALSRQSLYNMAELIKIKIRQHPRIINEINHTLYSLEPDFFVTKRNDNYYGRLFETELSKFIINNPNENMLKVRDAVTSYILDDFNKLSKNDQSALCENLGEKMYADPPAWRSYLTDANKFISHDNPENFIEMMKYSGDYSVPLVLSLAVKYIISSEGTRDLKNEATKYYINKILPQRQMFGSSRGEDSFRSTDYGLLLPYQKNLFSKKDDSLGDGIRPIDKYMRPTVGVELTEHDAVALSNERAIGIGMSGSSNILHFLFRKLQSENKEFPIDDAKLATASWLSYSGGHSFNEAYSVFGFMGQGNFKPLSFNELRTSSPLGEMAIKHSYNKVVEASVALSG